MMTNTQLELGLSTKNRRSRHGRRRTRATRARWWFSQMRNAVEKAVDWQTEPAHHPEQIWLAGARRSIKI